MSLRANLVLIELKFEPWGALPQKWVQFGIILRKNTFQKSASFRLKSQYMYLKCSEFNDRYNCNKTTYLRPKLNVFRQNSIGVSSKNTSHLRLLYGFMIKSLFGMGLIMDKKYFVTTMCRNDELSSNMSWLDCLLTDINATR